MTALFDLFGFSGLGCIGNAQNMAGAQQSQFFSQANAQNMLNAYRPPMVEMTPWDLGLKASDAPYSFWLGADK